MDEFAEAIAPVVGGFLFYAFGPLVICYLFNLDYKYWALWLMFTPPVFGMLIVSTMPGGPDKNYFP